MKRVLFCASSSLTALTLFSGFILSSITTSAEEIAISNVSISVPASCNLSTDTTNDTAHTANINNGTYKEDIGTTTFKVFCNDSGGFSVYAIGYSNQEYGNTNMIATVNNILSPDNNIVTGLATSGDTSNWAMKLNKVDGDYAPTILSDSNGSFSSYHIVPDDYTKIATFTSNTDTTVGSAFRSTYRTYISPKQPAGSYQGKVKYTLVRPSNGEAPINPQKVAYFDTGPNVNQKLSYSYSDLKLAERLPDDFVATSENTLSTADSPQPIYVYNDDDLVISYIYSPARKIYLNSDSSHMFEYSVISDSIMSNWDTSMVTNMERMFFGASVNSDNIKNFNTAKVSNMRGMFGADEGDPPAEILGGDSTTFANWDVSSVTDMTDMFHAYWEYNTAAMDNEVLKGLAKWDVSNVTSMEGMFSMTPLSDLSPLEGWDVSNVTNMSNMFYMFSISQQLSDLSPLEEWDVSSVDDMSSMFAWNRSLSDLSPLDKWNVMSTAYTYKMFAETGVTSFPDWCTDSCRVKNW